MRCSGLNRKTENKCHIRENNKKESYIFRNKETKLKNK